MNISDSRIKPAFSNLSKALCRDLCRSVPLARNLYIWYWAPIKITVEIPDDLFKRAKVLAAQEGLSLKHLITEALQQRVAGRSTETALEPAWKRAFGAMRSYRTENRRIEKIIEQEFEQIEPEDRG